MPDYLEFKRYLHHSAKGSTWKEHKYIKKVNGRYFYPKQSGGNEGRDHGNPRGSILDRSGRIKSLWDNPSEIDSRDFMSRKEAKNGVLVVKPYIPKDLGEMINRLAPYMDEDSVERLVNTVVSIARPNDDKEKPDEYWRGRVGRANRFLFGGSGTLNKNN